MASVTVEAQGNLAIVVSRALIFSAYALLLALLGELALVWILHRPFTSIWAFAITAGFLGFFPFSYLGVPLGNGLARLSKSRVEVRMTRALRLAVFAIFFAIVCGLSLATQQYLHYRQLHVDIDYVFLFPSFFLISSVASLIQNRRRI